MNKINPKYLAVGGKGFCNCFKNLMSVVRLNSESKTNVQRCSLVLEDPSLILNPEIDNKNDYIEHRGWRLKVLDSDNDIPEGFCETYDSSHPKWTDSVHPSKRHVDHQYLKIPMSFRKKINELMESRFRIKKFIKNIVDDFYERMGPYDSVHLRTFTPDRTYAMISRYNYYLRHQKQKYIEQINSCKHEKIFISYDYLPELESIKSQCKDKEILILNKINFGLEKYFEGYISHDEFINDFINLILLSKGDTMILHELSTFSEVAWFYSKFNENIVVI